ncbi:hypothetical protein ABK040_016270 [Willaertia magna]
MREDVVDRTGRYKALCIGIQNTEHSINKSLRGLDRLKKRLDAEEKKNAMNLLKGMKEQNETASIPYSKPRNKNKIKDYGYGQGLKSEDLSEEYMVPLRERYPTSNYDFELSDIEQVTDFDKDSKFYEQMHELIYSPRMSIPKFIEERKKHRDEEEKKLQQIAKQEAYQQKKKNIISKLKASNKILRLTGMLKQDIAEKKKANVTEAKTPKDVKLSILKLLGIPNGMSESWEKKGEHEDNRKHRTTEPNSGSNTRRSSSSSRSGSFFFFFFFFFF